MASAIVIAIGIARASWGSMIGRCGSFGGAGVTLPLVQRNLVCLTDNLIVLCEEKRWLGDKLKFFVGKSVGKPRDSPRNSS